MLHNKLPKIVKPRKLCHLGSTQGLTLSGTLVLEGLSKLSDKVLSEKAHAKLKLTFGLDEVGCCQIRATGSLKVKLKCQRCMQSLDDVLYLDSLLSPVVGDDEAKQLPPNFEPLMAPEDEVDLHEWIQEEVLLCLPIVPVHDAPCNEKFLNLNKQEEKAEKKLFPFAALKEQLKR
jgi:uncharacterized protein